jgi:hypothetical protein
LPHSSLIGGVGVGTSSSSPQAIKFIASSGTTTHRAADLGLRLITYPPRVQNIAMERRLHRTAVVKRRSAASQLVHAAIFSCFFLLFRAGWPARVVIGSSLHWLLR